ncbi:cytochrome P450 [Hydrogenophaga sp. BPS33]|nr:cytochrome P450 [Hydrogenophaga sp. BPS33]
MPLPRDDGPLNPPGGYARLRSECPVSRATLWDGSEAWVVTRWQDVRAVLSSPSFSSDPNTPGFQSLSQARQQQVLARNTFINMDDPEHARFRRMLTRDFMQKRMGEMKPQVDSLLEGLYAGLEQSPQPSDFMEKVANPLPVMVVSLLIGVPFEDFEMLGRWSNLRIDHRAAPQEIRQATLDMEAYFENAIRERLKKPGDASDLLTRLVQEQLQPGHIELEELVRLSALLYSAGHGTTSTQIGMGTLTLLRHPEQKDAMAADPALVPRAIEEMLRYNAIAHLNSSRVAIADVEIGGQSIKAGESVHAMLVAANRDPATFENPDRFDIHRQSQPHVAFSYGVHQCLGQPLARLELNAVFSTLFQRFPRLQLAVPFEELRFNAMSQVYGVEALPVTW